MGILSLQGLEGSLRVLPHILCCLRSTHWGGYTWWKSQYPGRHQPPTCSDHLLNFDTGDVNFLGKLPHCLIGVLVGEWVDVDLHAWGH